MVMVLPQSMVFMCISQRTSFFSDQLGQADCLCDGRVSYMYRTSFNYRRLESGI